MHSTDPGRSPRRAPALRRGLACGAGVITALALGAAPAAQADSDASQLPSLVTTDNIREHMESLQTIAEANGGNRASATPGYDVAAKYVTDQLERAGYTPKKDEYTYDKWSENSDPAFSQTKPEQHDFAHEKDFLTMEFSGAGDVSAPGAAVNPDSDESGCSASDFSDFPKGAVAIIKRGTCDFKEKADNATEAGAAAAVVFNHGNSDAPEDNDPVDGTLSSRTDIPVIGASSSVGEELAGAGGDLELNIEVDAEVTTETSYNITADTRTGRKDNVVVAGAHLDGVPEGPGINDNGSGTATVLETARQFAKLDQPTNANRVRFAFWGTEEEGLVGSTKYVEGLNDDQVDDLGLYLNFDMLGSPNFGRFVYDGRGELEGSLPPPSGSAAIQKLFEDYYKDRGLVTEPTEFDGRSDYSAFMEAGVPAGGLFSGADGVKSEKQVEYYGGTAGENFDPNYHTAKDDIDNVSWTSVDQLSDGVAHAVETYADSTLPVNGVRKAPAAGPARQADHWLR